MLPRIAAAVIFFIAGLCGLSPVDGQILYGRVTNAASGEPLSGANLIIEGTTTGTVTATNGTFRIPLSDVPAVLVVSHLSCNTRRINIDATPFDSLFISLIPATHELGTVQISSNPVEEVMKGTSWDILDFEFLKDNLLLLANANGNMFKPSLLMVTIEGDTLASLRVDRPGELYRDYSGNIFYLNARSAWDVDFENGKFRLTYVTDIGDFLSTYPLVVDACKPVWMIKQYARQQLELNYYRYNEETNTVNLFCCVTNEAAIARNRWGAYFDGNEADQDFANRIINKPVQAPIYRTPQGFTLFDFVNNEIKLFDEEGESVNTVRADFMKGKQGTGEIYRDLVTGDFYTRYQKAGLSAIYKIDEEKGTVTFCASIPRFVFVENIIIRNHLAFFLYKDQCREEAKKVFKMKL